MNNEIEKEEKEQFEIIKPNKIELELSKEKKQVCREIVKEINNFGIEQRQKLFIIELLALELENREAMLKLKNCVSEIREQKLVRTKKELILK